MNNIDKYYFADFTRENYRNLIKIAKQNYNFCFFNEFNNISKPLLWRHDVDISMHASKKLAIIEQDEYVKSTFFIHLHSEFYNVFEKEITFLIKDIIAMGHQIGLHFDTHYYNVDNENDLTQYIEFEKIIIEKLFNISITSFSFHNTTPFTMSCQEWEYAGLINTYSKTFQQEFTYCSDSFGIWRFKRLKDFLQEDNKKIQVLTHPEWWQDEILSPKKRLYRAVNGRAEKIIAWHEDVLKKQGLSLID
jgi:hypothetical protein